MLLVCIVAFLEIICFRYTSSITSQLSNPTKFVYIKRRAWHVMYQNILTYPPKYPPKYLPKYLSEYLHKYQPKYPSKNTPKYTPKYGPHKYPFKYSPRNKIYGLNLLTGNTLQILVL